MMGMFKRIGAIIDDMFSNDVSPEKETKPEDIVRRGTEMAVTLFETEFGQFRLGQGTLTGGILGKDARLPAPRYSHPLGVDLYRYMGWMLFLGGDKLPLDSEQVARLDKVLVNQDNQKKAASVERLAEAIVARGKTSENGEQK